MKTHTVIDGNAFYEVDDECRERMRRQAELETAHMPGQERQKRQAVAMHGIVQADGLVRK